MIAALSTLNTEASNESKIGGMDSSECSSEAPRTHAQRRLDRRKLCWLAHVAFERSTLLALRLVPTQERDLPMLMEKSFTATACQTDLDEISSIVSACETNSVSPSSVNDGNFLEQSSTACLRGSAEQLNYKDSFAETADPLQQLIIDLAAVSCDEMFDNWQQLDEALKSAISQLPACAPLLHEDYSLEEEDWLQKGTIVQVENKRSSLLFSFPESIGIVLQTQRHLRNYVVKFILSGIVGAYPWHDVDELFEATLCNLYQRPSLNGLFCWIDGFLDGDDSNRRLRVRLESSETILVKPTSLCRTKDDSFYAENFPLFMPGFK
jgi:hypothetical protein